MSSVRPVQQIFDRVVAEIKNDAPHFMGPEFMAQYDRPPRYVWVPTKDRFEAGEKTNIDPRPLYTVREGVEVRCWGSDYDTAWQLRNDVLAVLKRLVAGTCQVEGGEWSHRTFEDGSATELGRIYILDLTFAIPVTDRRWITIPIASVSHQSKLVFPAGEIVACEG